MYEVERGITNREMGEKPQSSTEPVISLFVEDVNKITHLLNVLKKTSTEARKHPNDLIFGIQPQLPSVENKPGVNPITDAHNIPISVNHPMILDAEFEKWDKNILTWTPHYYFLKIQCKIYQPLLVTDEVVFKKIYESIPEPKRQRISGYWIECGKKTL